MTRRGTWILTLLLAFAIGLAGYWFVRNGWLHVQAALAEEQTQYFEEARNKALQSSRPEDIVEYIEGTLNYYPSGSKQTSGSHLDRIVERARRLAVDDMIRRLQSKTGLDLGDDPQKWIERFDGHKNQPDGAATGSQPSRSSADAPDSTADSRDSMTNVMSEAQANAMMSNLLTDVREFVKQHGSPLDWCLESAKTNCNPQLLREWALSTISDEPSKMVITGFVEHLYPGGGVPLVFVCRSPSSNACVQLSWGGGFGKYGLLIGGPQYRPPTNWITKKWTAGIYGWQTSD